MGNHHVILQSLQNNLHSSDRRVQFKAVKRLCKVCEDEQMQEQIVEAGGIQTLLRLCDSCRGRELGEDSIAVVVRASRALYYLSARPDVAAMISDFGMGTLEGLAKMKQDDVLLYTVGIVERVAQRVGHFRCLEAGVMRPLSLLMKQRASAHRALLLLCELSVFPAAQVQTVHLHCVTPLISAFRGPSQYVLASIITLTNIATHSADFRRVIIQAGALDPLLQLMLHATDDDELPYRAASAVCTLAGAADERDTRTQVKDTVTFYPFLILAASGSPRLLNVAARGLSVVLDSNREWLTVVHIHGLSFLVALLAANDIVWLVYVVHRIHGLASQLFMCEKCCQTTRIVRWHCHQCEKDFCRDCYQRIAQDPLAHDRNHEMAVFQEDLCETMLEQGVLPRLADSVSQFLAKEQTSESEREYVVVALSTLAVLAAKEIAKIGMMDTGILTIIHSSLSSMVQGPDDFLEQVRLQCISILRQLAECDLNTHQLMECGFLNIVMPYIDSHSPDIQRHAVLILARLGPVLLDNGCPALLECPRGIMTLMNVAYTDDAMIQTGFVQCLCALATQGNPDVGQSLVAEGVLERLYYYLTACDLNEKLRTECVAAIRHLQPYDYAQVLTSDDWMAVFTDLVLKPECQLCSTEDLLAAVANILRDLSSLPERRASVASLKTITVLDKCCEAFDQETTYNSVKCLLNISYFDNTSEISTPICEVMLKTLTRLAFRTPKDEPDRLLLRTISACMANLAAQQPLKMVFDQQAVNATISLAGTQDQVVQLNAVRCLKNLTLNGPLMVRESTHCEDVIEQMPLTLKCHMGETAVLLSVARTITYSDLMRVLSEEYKQDVGIKYTDFNNDLVAVVSQWSWETAKAQHEQRCKDLPAHHRVFDLYLSAVPENPPISSIPSNGSAPSSGSHNTGSFEKDIDFTSPSARHRRIRWKKGNFLGCGAFAMVYQGLNVDTGQLMAVKQIDMTGERSAEEILSFEKEIELLQRFSHPNIVQYLGAQRDGNHLDIFLQYIPGGSIAGLLQKYGRFPEKVIKGYARQILQGLSYLHRNGIVHRDIKGANILVMDDGVIKLADFGASRKILELTGEPAQNKSILGTPGYMAPEVIQKRVFSEKSDLWSVGATVYEMYCGSRPYSEISNPYAIMYHVVRSGAPTIPSFASHEGRNFLNRCFQSDPDLRPTADELLQDPFLERPPSASSSVCSNCSHEEEMEIAPTMLSEPSSQAETLTSLLNEDRTMQSKTFTKECVTVIRCPYASVCNVEPFASVDALHEHLARFHLSERGMSQDSGSKASGHPVLDYIPGQMDIWNCASYSATTPSPDGTPLTAMTPSISSPLVDGTPVAGTPLAAATPNAGTPRQDAGWTTPTPVGTPGSDCCTPTSIFVASMVWSEAAG